MPLPLILARQAVPVLRRARAAQKEWKTLPAEHREATRASAERVARLVGELSAMTAMSAARRSPTGAERPADRDSATRPADAVIAELRKATDALLGSPAVPIAAKAMRPRSRATRVALKVGTKTAATGSSQFSRMRSTTGDEDMAVTEQDLTPVLRAGERVIACIPSDGLHAGGAQAAKLPFKPTNPHVLVTDQRISFLSRKGIMGKRFEELASWPRQSFTSRLNSNEGAALGPFMYFVTLFTEDGDTVSAAFKSERQRESYRSMIVNAFGDG